MYSPGMFCDCRLVDPGPGLLNQNLRMGGGGGSGNLPGAPPGVQRQQMGGNFVPKALICVESSVSEAMLAPEMGSYGTVPRLGGFHGST